MKSSVRIQRSVEVEMRVIVKIVLSHEVLEKSQFPHFQKEIERLIESGGKILMLDFSKINFLKNSELMAVVAIVKLVRDSECILLISAMSQQVRILFELTGLEQIFQCLPPAEENSLKSDLTEPLGDLQSVAG
ncbi:STAS domain-containing protein [Microcoleus sp. F10-C6]|uniref:STAS domain-containing protein n=1 Tax=unclassified Microcoleus TaxID=2642155 RepID=UPI002FD0A73A